MDNLKNKGGRPRLASGNRSIKIVSRFTDDEYKQILALEQELGINRSQIIRTRVLHNADMIVVNSKELIKHLDSIGAEMGRAGNNINQLARHANLIKLTGNLPPAIAEKFNNLLESYVGMQGVLEMSLRKIIRMMAK
ncbi:plasmid mobilization protein [Mucilaginibacter glaciei]|uniref:Plasmid mobilization relaxosome protein MobC n=1 Tax=Mucilaginibacter glaciei TaxID=2772109 RepID=A0A926S2I2_9SPHI|nr:plasmid mobilization relaxosome protein MobC [Mucilaginibacter glaciei]MBD1395155.1 plasmid mobilization relaxosome protein MobC [Mucilaginibacter glaciei]